MQTPPHRYYWGLDRKLRLSLVAFPGSSAVSELADTHCPAAPALPETSASTALSSRRLLWSSQMRQAGGPCSELRASRDSHFRGNLQP